MLKVKGLTKSFNTTEAVKGLSFSVMPGEVLGLLGPNGAGKSTTLNAISGQVRLDQGEISVCDFDVRRNPVDAKRRFAYVSDPPILMEGASCMTHILFIARVFGMRESVLDAKLPGLIARFQLENVKDKSVTDLSKGMRQRLALLLAFIHSPELILLDEPTTGLDPAAIMVLNEMIREVAKAGAAVVVSSHLLGILEEVCTKVLILDEGKPVLYGTLEDVRSQSDEIRKNASLKEIFLFATKDNAA